MEVLVGIGCLILGGFGLYQVRNWFNDLKKNGDQNTAPFILMGMWSTLIFNLALMGIGVLLVFKLM